MVYLQSAMSRPRVAAATLLVAAGLISGCMSDKDKIKKLVDKEVQNCRKSEDTFYEVEVVDGGSQQVLAQTCQAEIGEVEMVDNYEATVKVGPYTWMAGLSTENNLWQLKDVSWETLDSARRRLERAEDDMTALKAAAEKFGQAQSEFPESTWIRFKQLNLLLRIRKKVRAQNDDVDPLKIGDQARQQLKSIQEWASKNDAPATGARAVLDVVNYYQDYIDILETNRESAASKSSEERYKKLIKAAEDAGDDEEAEDYRKDLEKIREQRPEKIAEYDKKLEAARLELCEVLDKLSPTEIEKQAVRKKAESAKASLDCKALRKKAKDKDKAEAGSEDGGDPQ